MNRSLLFLLSFVLFGTVAVAHFGGLRGTVKDDRTLLAVAGVKISLSETDFKTITDSSGKFELFNIPAASYVMTATGDGYRLKATKIEVIGDSIATVEIEMQSNNLNLPQVFVCADKPLSAASSKVISNVDFEMRPKNSAQDLLRLVPGLFIAQHAGGGKAEQLFLRGFDCDHGTDVAIYADGMPVNMPSHGHGQGYADAHFIIPEAVEEMDVNKGPYFIQNGDFATAGAVRFKTADDLQNNKVIEEIGTTPGHRDLSSNRDVFMFKVPTGTDVTSAYFASELFYNPGYFDRDQQMLRFNLFGKLKTQLNESSSLTFETGGFGSSWNAVGQIPERSVVNGMITRFGSIDSSEGGTTGRTYMNLDYHHRQGKQEFDLQAYKSNYNFKLFSDFTFFLNDPVHGDEIEQTDNRSVYGVNTSYSFFNDAHAVKFKTTVGGGLRNDNINNGLFHDEKQTRLDAVREDQVVETATDFYVGEDIFWTDKLKTNVGLRYDYFIFNVDDLLPRSLTNTDVSGYNYQQLLSPKFNVVYSSSDQLQFFFNSGIGYHSNDARSVVVEQNNHQLPLALGSEIGTTIRSSKFVFSMALWNLDLENELVYNGDNGTTVNNGPSRRTGVDAGIRYNLSDRFYTDIDCNYAHGRFLDKRFGNELSEGGYIPLAPVFTSTGGVTYRHPKGFQSSLRYRYKGDCPANESNTVVAKGYTVVDWVTRYRYRSFEFGVTVENVLNTKWDEAEFDTTSRLFNEAAPVDEIHFTAGTPRAFKLSVGYSF